MHHKVKQHKRMRRCERGGSIAEFAAALVFGLPLLICLIYVSLETAHFYTIKSAMDVGARNAARALVINYNRTGSETKSVNFITIPNYIASSNQFGVTWDAASPPTYVTVSCSYPSGGGNGLPPFPAGPLRYLTPNVQFYLGTFSVTSEFTYPIQ